MSDSMQERWYTVAEIAERLAVHPQTVRAWLKSGDLEGVNFMGHTGWRVRSSALERYIAKRAMASRVREVLSA